ncbi:UNKNOWN [Stylonychia lemnae]|uniref:Transmembrane protein n=1 Tax=Stylonychia lemnae TaxID=5949 RepID=A0A078AQR2_STYLE|nr:UNKNOWN [Stylonychia lemnae]|eukprot:CDW84775.1 UNKNOWN [Stylonychia lemnae]
MQSNDPRDELQKARVTLKINDLMQKSLQLQSQVQLLQQEVELNKVKLQSARQRQYNIRFTAIFLFLLLLFTLALQNTYAIKLFLKELFGIQSQHKFHIHELDAIWNQSRSLNLDQNCQNNRLALKGDITGIKTIDLVDALDSITQLDKKPEITQIKYQILQLYHKLESKSNEADYTIDRLFRNITQSDNRQQQMRDLIMDVDSMICLIQNDKNYGMYGKLQKYVDQLQKLKASLDNYSKFY